MRALIASVLPFVLIGAMLGGTAIALSTPVLAVPVAVLAVIAMIAVPTVAYYALVASIPVYFGYTTGGKLQMAILLPLVAIMLLNACTKRGPWPAPLRWPESYLCILFVIMVAASLLVSANPNLSLLASVALYGPMTFIFFATMAFVRDKEDLDRLLWWLIAVGVMEAAVAVVETKYGVRFSVVLFEEQTKGTVVLSELAAVGTTWHPMVLGGFMMMIIPIAVFQIIMARDRLVQLGCLAAALLLLAACWWSASRSSLIGLAVAFFTAVMITSRGARYAAIGVAFVVLPMVAFDSSLVGEAVIEFEKAVIPDFLKRGGEHITSAWNAFLYRAETWGMAWNTFKSYPLLGLGTGESANSWVPEFLPPWAITWGPVTSPGIPNAGVTHNVFLLILAENGIFAFSAFVGLWLWAIRCMVVAARHKELRPYAVLLAAMLASHFVHMSFNPIVRDLWLTIALAAVLGRIASKQTSPTRDLEEFQSGRETRAVTG